jgi:hypothetical protein
MGEYVNAAVFLFLGLVIAKVAYNVWVNVKKGGDDDI